LNVLGLFKLPIHARLLHNYTKGEKHMEKSKYYVLGALIIAVIVIGLIPVFQAEDKTKQRAEEAAITYVEEKGHSSFTVTQAEILPTDSEAGANIIEVKGYADDNKNEEIIVHLDYAKKLQIVKSTLPDK
jgi:hypothetical protein